MHPDDRVAPVVNLELKKPEFIVFEHFQHYKEKKDTAYLFPKSKTQESVDSIWLDGEERFAFQITVNNLVDKVLPFGS